MGIFDGAMLLGAESPYGTAATLDHAFEAETLGGEITKERIDSTGFRAGQQTKRADRTKWVPMGGAGKMAFDVPTKGFNFMLPAFLGPVGAPVQQATSTAYKTTGATTVDGPDYPLTIQLIKPDVTGTLTPFTHVGSVLTDWELSHPLNGNLKFSADWVSAEVRTDIAAGAAAYPADNDTFDWTMAGYTIAGGNFRCTESFNLKAGLGFKTNRICQRQDFRRKQPTRVTLPEFSGELNIEYNGNDVYDAFANDTEVEIVAHWLGPEIEPGHNYELKITMPLCLIGEGASPEISASSTDLPMQKVPFDVYHGASDAMTIEITSTDTTL